MPQGRFVLQQDMNSDGVFTITDVYEWIKEVIFFPGDFLVRMLLEEMPEVALFFEFSPEDYRGFFSGTVSIIAWLMVWGIIFAASEWIDETWPDPKE